MEMKNYSHKKLSLHCHQLTKILNSYNTKFGRDIKQQAFSYTAGGSIKWYNLFEEHFSIRW